MEWNDESAIDWTSITGICGFLDGSCTDKECGARHHDFVLHTGVGVGYAVQKMRTSGEVPTLWMLNLVVVPRRLTVSKNWMQKAESRPEVVKI